MTRRFLDNLSLQHLIAPLPVEEFRSRNWEQQPVIVRRNDPAYYGDLFTLEDFDETIIRSPDYVKMANAVTKKFVSYKASATRGLESVLEDMRNGGTIVLDQLHHRDPKLSLLCRVLAQELGHRFQTNLYLTPPNGQGFSPHWDNHDVFILQVLGSKNWKMEKKRRIFPAKHDSMGDEGRELRGEVDAFTLEQGDLIYIPRGFVHAAECGPQPSLHITLGFTAVFWEDLVQAAVKTAIQRDERLRRVLPLGFVHGSGDALVKRLKGAFRDIADETFLAGALDHFLDEVVTSYPLDVSGQVLENFRPTPLTLDETVGPRRAIIYRLHEEGETVRLNFGARTITFRDFFGAALKFALTTPAYAIRALPGDLEDEERIVFIERLVQEGLVVRHKSAQA